MDDGANEVKGTQNASSPTKDHSSTSCLSNGRGRHEGRPAQRLEQGSNQRAGGEEGVSLTQSNGSAAQGQGERGEGAGKPLRQLSAPSAADIKQAEEEEILSRGGV